jgi:hypothetical protein
MYIKSDYLLLDCFKNATCYFAFQRFFEMKENNGKREKGGSVPSPSLNIPSNSLEPGWQICNNPLHLRIYSSSPRILMSRNCRNIKLNIRMRHNPSKNFIGTENSFSIIAPKLNGMAWCTNNAISHMESISCVH